MVPVEVTLPDWPYASLQVILFAEAAAAFEDLTLSRQVDQLKMQVPDGTRVRVPVGVKRSRPGLAGSRLSRGYMKTPPRIRMRCTSATSDAIHRILKSMPRGPAAPWTHSST